MVHHGQNQQNLLEGMLVLLVLVLDKLLDKQLGQAHRLGKPTYAFAP